MSVSPYAVAVVALALAGLAVLVTRDRDLRRRWLSWALITPAVALPLLAGPVGACVLAVALGVVAVGEYAALTRLARVDRWVLTGLAVLAPVAAVNDAHLLSFAALAALGSAVAPVVQGDVENGARRACATAFGVVWICWPLAHLVLLADHAFVVLLATATADVAAWCGGRGLRRFAWARAGLSSLSPNKTRGGVVGAVVGAALLLALVGQFHFGLVLVVAVGGLFGDLLESMVKRQAGVKDAGSWLPGFGGLLDRIDSMLVVLPLAFLLS